MTSTKTRDLRTAAYRHRRLEMLIFAAVSVVGIFALGEGLRGLFRPDAGIALAWLGIAGGSLWLLYAQMCRVKETWPRRPQRDLGRASKPAPITRPSTTAEEL